MLPGPPWTDIGEPGALVNNDCCDVFEGVSPERHELEDTASNKLNRATRPIAAGILIAEVTPVSLRLIGKTLQRRSFFPCFLSRESF